MSKDKRTSIYFDRKKLQFVNLEESYIKNLQETYKGVDVRFELKKMGIWLMSPKGKNRRGNGGFILNWLNNATPSQAPAISEQIDQSDSPLRPLLDEYIEELWKGREHILEFNRIRKKS